MKPDGTSAIPSAFSWASTLLPKTPARLLQ
jgi:hypothetical protein